MHPTLTNEGGDGRLSVVHRFERLEPGTDVAGAVPELGDVADTSAGRRSVDLTDAVRRQSTLRQPARQLVEQVPELGVPARHDVHVLTLSQ